MSWVLGAESRGTDPQLGFLVLPGLCQAGRGVLLLHLGLREVQLDKGPQTWVPAREVLERLLFLIAATWTRNNRELGNQG